MKVKSNPQLATDEKECIIRFTNSGNAIVHSLIPTGMKYLLANDDAEILDKDIKTIDGTDYIVGVKAELPIGYIKLSASNRSSQTAGSVFSNQMR